MKLTTIITLGPLSVVHIVEPEPEPEPAPAIETEGLLVSMEGAGPGLAKALPRRPSLQLVAGGRGR